MSKKLIVGIATGVAAVVIIGVIAKRTGLLNTILDKISGLADTVEDKFNDFEKIGMHDLIPKGEDKNVSKSVANNN